jgi:hypothetical protein
VLCEVLRKTANVRMLEADAWHHENAAVWAHHEKSGMDFERPW